MSSKHIIGVLVLAAACGAFAHWWRGAQVRAAFIAKAKASRLKC